MTREICGEKQDIKVCRLKKGHSGDHKAWSKTPGLSATWHQTEVQVQQQDSVEVID